MTQKNQAVANLFGGKKAPKAKKTSKKAPREEIEFPKELRDAADVMCAYRTVKDDLKKKGEVAEKRCESFMKRWWCEKYALTGKKPDMARFLGNRSGVDFIQTRRMTLTAEKQEALEMMGVDLADHTEVSGMDISMEAIVRLGYMDKLQEAIANMVSDPEHVSEIFSPKITVKEGILEALPEIAKESEIGGSLADQMEQILDVLKPTTQKKKPQVEGATLSECFEIVTDSKLGSTKA